MEKKKNKIKKNILKKKITFKFVGKNSKFKKSKILIISNCSKGSLKKNIKIRKSGNNK